MKVPLYDAEIEDGESGRRKSRRGSYEDCGKEGILSSSRAVTHLDHLNPRHMQILEKIHSDFPPHSASASKLSDFHSIMHKHGVEWFVSAQ